MCGICGIIGSSFQQNIEAMLSAMHHRGPDDSGIFRENSVTVGMTRLAILDVSPTGHQPMSNPDGTVWIVYNGETYNFQTEREILRGKGYTFSSSSDTEVVLRMYEHYGDDFLLRMRGMFALAIYDKRRGLGQERLVLARDHLGIKPLLYAKTQSGLVFASEMKSMLASGLIAGKIDPEAVRQLLTYGSVIQPKTIIDGICMLLPGHRMILEQGREKTERYWSLGINRYPDLREKTHEELVDYVRSALQECVSLQMVSDVPIGAFLSGGIDSSLLVALISKISGHKVKTFSVGFEAEGSRIDETDDAARIAGYIGTDHHRVVVTGQDVRDNILHIATALDQPSVDGVNSYFVSLAAGRDVTVAISGTGGDELFAGYPWFSHMELVSNLDKRHPAKTSIKRILAGIARHDSFNQLLFGHYGHVIERLRGCSGFVPRYIRQYQIFGVMGAARTLAPDIKPLTKIGCEPAYDIALADELPNGLPVERVSALCLRGYTQNQLLRDIDAVSMAHSLEVRVPFLDPVIADIALSLPASSKIGNQLGLSNHHEATYRESGRKRILIDIAKDLLPEDMDAQQKRGFGMPFDSWLKGSLREILEDTLSDLTVRNRGLFDERETRILKQNFLGGQCSWALPWLLMITELWCREVLESSKPKQ